MRGRRRIVLSIYTLSVCVCRKLQFVLRILFSHSLLVGHFIDRVLPKIGGEEEEGGGEREEEKGDKREKRR